MLTKDMTGSSLLPQRGTCYFSGLPLSSHYPKLHCIVRLVSCTGGNRVRWQNDDGSSEEGVTPRPGAGGLVCLLQKQARHFA